LSKLHIVRAVVGATAQVPDSVFERHSPFDPHTVGEQLTEQVIERVRDASLGYYPALDYLRERGMLDTGLLDVVDQLTWLATSLTGEELRSRLRPVFSGVQLQSMQAIAYSMPPSRPGQPNARQQLLCHLTPNRVRFDLLLTLFRRPDALRRLDCYIEDVLYRQLRESFDSIDVGSVRILE
jgi:hypothetical protein